jgi:hypothetical protein
VRGYFEPRFGQGLEGVRIHTDATAAQSAESIGAEAYTLSSHVAFAADRYRPYTGAGRHLLAHELAHVVQDPAAGVVRPYRDMKRSEREIKNWGAVDDPAAALVEKPRPGKDDPVIELIQVVFSGKAPDTLNPGELLVTGTLTTKYRAVDKRPDIVIPVTGGSTADRPFGLTDSIPHGGKVHTIEGPGYSDRPTTGRSDAQPAPKGEKSRYVKQTSTADHAAFDFMSSMGLAVYFKGPQAIHLGDKAQGSHACVHVDWTANKEHMRFINYHSLMGFTTVTVEYENNEAFRDVCCTPTRRRRGFVNPCGVLSPADCAPKPIKP